jgi:hypothetical protein
VSARALPWLLLPVAAGVTWFALRGCQATDPSLEPPPEPPRRTGAPTFPRDLPAPPPLPPGPPPERGPVDPGWMSQEFLVPAGDATLSGAELIQALEASGTWKVTEGEPGTLAALRQETFQAAQRGRREPYAAVMGWLKEAGYRLETAPGELRVMRLPDEERPPR